MLAAAPAMGLGGVAAAAEADGMKPRFEATANVAFVSDYLARGITVSDRDPTVQGGFDFSAAGGWSAGVWASGIDGGPGATLEMDIVAGKTFAIGEGELAVGGTWYHYPGGHDLDYGEVTASWAQPIGEVDTTFGVAYAWEQEATADADNTYVYANIAAPLGEVATLPLTLGASLGYEEGPLAVEADKVDWSLSLSADVAGFTMSASYVGTDLHDDIGRDTGVITLARSF